MSLFKLHSEYKPGGDQPKAIKELLAGLEAEEKSQMLLGITGSGKTFTMANVIAASNRPSLIMAHNKTLAAQIYSELKSMFHIMIIINRKHIFLEPIPILKKIRQLTSRSICSGILQPGPCLNAET